VARFTATMLVSPEGTPDPPVVVSEVRGIILFVLINCSQPPFLHFAGILAAGPGVVGILAAGLGAVGTLAAGILAAGAIVPTGLATGFLVESVDTLVFTGLDNCGAPPSMYLPPAV